MPAILGDDKGTAQSTADDLRGAMNIGRSAAKGAKTVSKAAAQAASGNVAGAAATVLTDPETLKNILIILMIPVILLAAVMVFFLYALPTAIFESIVSFFDGINERWESVKASNAYGGSFLSTLGGVIVEVSDDLFDAVGDALGSIFSGIWNGIKNVFGADTEGNQTEPLSQNASELTITAQEASEKLAIVKKAIAVNKKYMIRAEQIEAALDGNASSIYNSSGVSIDKYMETRFCAEDEIWCGTSINANIVALGTTDDSVIDDLEDELKAMQNVSNLQELEEAKENFNHSIQAKFPITEASGATNADAVSLMSLLMVQQGGSLQDMKMSDFLKYLGWYENGNPDNVSMDVGYCSSPFTTSVKSWKGTFKPQYLMEEMKTYKQEKALLESYLKSSPNSDMASEWEDRIQELDDHIAMYENSGMPLIDLMMYLDFIDLDDLPTPTTSPSSYGDGGTMYTYCSPDGESKLLYDHYYVWHESLGGKYKVWYNKVRIEAYIVPRGVDNISYQFGLWNGSLDTVQGGDVINGETNGNVA